MLKLKVSRIVIAVMVIIGLLGLAGCGAGAPANSPTAPANSSTSGAATPTPNQPKVIQVGSDLEGAPMEMVSKDNKPEGFDIDMMAAICKENNWEPKWESASFDGLIPSLQAGKYDAIMSSITITEERAKSVLFSDPYFMATQYIITKKDSTVKTEGDLKRPGLRVGVQNTTTGQIVCEKMGLNPKKYETMPDVFNALINGEVDAVVFDSVFALYFIQQNPGLPLTYVTGDFPKEYYGIAMQSGNKEMADKINAAIKKVKEDGTYNQIYKKWFGVDAPKF